MPPHAFRLANPEHAVSAADDFYALQRASYMGLHDIALPDSAWAQATVPIRFGGHGFTITRPFLQFSAAASIINAAPARERTAACTTLRSFALFGHRYRGDRSFPIRQALTPLREFLLCVPGDPYSVDVGPLPQLYSLQNAPTSKHIKRCAAGRMGEGPLARRHLGGLPQPGSPVPQGYGTGDAASRTGTAPQSRFSLVPRRPPRRCTRHTGRPCSADISDSPSTTRCPSCQTALQ